MVVSTDVNAQTLPIKVYEPTMDFHGGKARAVYIEVPYNVETGEAERIAVDWTARGGGSGTSCALWITPVFSWLTHMQWNRICRRNERQSRCCTTESSCSSNMWLTL